MGCDYVMYTCKNGKMEKSGHVSGGPHTDDITETREFICSCADGLTVYIWENNGLKEKVKAVVIRKKFLRSTRIKEQRWKCFIPVMTEWNGCRNLMQK